MKRTGSLPQSCGCFTITVTAKGAYTGSLQMGGTAIHLAGNSISPGQPESIVHGNANGLTVDLQLDLAGGRIG